MKKITTMPESKFLKVICDQCKNDQIIFSKASTVVKCLVCGNILAEPTGGVTRLKANVDKVFT